MSIQQDAINIATNSLRACYVDKGIIAGPHHFTDYWARDSYFASLGSLAIGDHKIVSEMVALFFDYQRKDGLIPYRIMRGPLSLSKYLGKPNFYTTPKPTYRLRGVGQPVLDGTTLSVLFAALLEKPEYLPKIKLALHYLEAKEKHGLLWDGPMGEWNDAVWKWGNLLYSNIIYWYMYDRLTNWTKDFDPVLSSSLALKTTQIAKSIRERLWNGKYFSDWHDFKRQDYLYPFGNCLAIAWGFTTPSESKSILQECGTLQQNFSLETNSPKYPWWRVDLLQRLVGMADYQNHGILWWQPITSYLAALKQFGDLKSIQEVSNSISQKLVDDNQVSECYERDGRAVQRTIYTSEHPFAWASGMILWSLAYNVVHDKK